MASGEARQKYEDAPLSFKSVVWRHFGFAVDYDADETKTVNKKMTVCKHCYTQFTYLNRNASKMSAHLWRHHPAISLSGSRMPEQVTQSSKKQQSLADSFQQLIPRDTKKK